MKWYYSENGAQAGPVSQSEFDTLIQRGSITPDTLVWNDGMANWARLREVPTAGGAAVSGAGSARCVECGQVFPVSEMITLEGQTVCGNCKPRFVQKLREGIAPDTELRYAGFWIRVGAKMVDGIILQIVNVALQMAAGAVLGAGSREAGVASMVLGLVVGLSYVTYFTGKFGATPGKMALKLKVVRPDGSPITYGRAFGRYFAELLSAFTLTIGYLMVGWDEQKRALHDRVADTRVIRR